MEAGAIDQGEAMRNVHMRWLPTSSSTQHHLFRFIFFGSSLTPHEHVWRFLPAFGQGHDDNSPAVPERIACWIEQYSGMKVGKFLSRLFMYF